MVRKFNPDDYLQKKIVAINKFFTDEGLDSAVIGISGGIDSAVAFYLLDAAKNAENSPIKKIIPLSIPIYKAPGVSGQWEADIKARHVIKHRGYTPHTINLQGVYQDMVSASPDEFSEGLNSEELAWAEGQMASILRTPVLYYHAALLQAKGLKSIVVGTTNRDEGSYIGFFGKASDAMVDLQPIADIHKSEVYKIAKLLNVPKEIIEEIPKGDVWDKKVDEEMIGAPYWALELFLSFKEANPNSIVNAMNRGRLVAYLSDAEGELFLKYAEAIETIHKKNAHKYKVGNQARFIDVMDRKITGGWDDFIDQRIKG